MCVHVRATELIIQFQSLSTRCACVDLSINVCVLVQRTQKGDGRANPEKRQVFRNHEGDKIRRIGTGRECEDEPTYQRSSKTYVAARGSSWLC